MNIDPAVDCGTQKKITFFDRLSDLGVWFGLTFGGYDPEGLLKNLTYSRAR
jgi:hypothetical protein